MAMLHVGFSDGKNRKKAETEENNAYSRNLLEQHSKMDWHTRNIKFIRNATHRWRCMVVANYILH